MKIINYYQLIIVSILMNMCTDLLPMEHPAHMLSRAAQTEMARVCPVCFGEEPAVEFRPLACGHLSSCVECLREQVRVTLQRGAASGVQAHLRCLALLTNPLIPDYSKRCEYAMNEADMRAIGTNEQLINRYNNFGRRIFGPINGNNNNNNNEQENTVVQFTQEVENALHKWLGENAKPCPACKVSVEKIDGCRHMIHDRSIGGCGHEYCWHCLQPWENHGMHNGRYFNKFLCIQEDLDRVNAHNITLLQHFNAYLISLGDNQVVRYFRNSKVAACLVIVSIVAGTSYKIYKAIKK